MGFKTKRKRRQTRTKIKMIRTFEPSNSEVKTKKNRETNQMSRNNNCEIKDLTTVVEKLLSKIYQ